MAQVLRGKAKWIKTLNKIKWQKAKRTFQSAKMDRDADERILRPGEYRDALNISVDFFRRRQCWSH